MPKIKQKMRTLKLELSCNRRGAHPESVTYTVEMTEAEAMQHYWSLIAPVEQAFKDRAFWSSRGPAMKVVQDYLSKTKRDATTGDKLT